MEWELSKENVQPLKQGRNIDTLNSTLTADKSNEIEIQKREAKRREFEGELRTYSGDDPLEVWHSYICWIEQNYPQGGHDCNIIKIIEHCLQEFTQVKKYIQDKRLLEIVLKYIKFVSDPLEILNFMYQQNICTHFAQFYIEWSWIYENCCNNLKADEILLFGIEKLAQPIEDIELARKNLQMRVAKNLIQSGKASDNDGNDLEKRQALNNLKGKKQSGSLVAPNTRIGNAIIKKREGLTYLKPGSLKNNAPAKIFVDENDSASIHGDVQSAKLVTKKMEQENEIKPGKWNENALNKPNIPELRKEFKKFEIYTESEDESDFRPPTMTNVLKARRRGADSPPVVIFNKKEDNTRFYCDIRKIYAGATEFSIEEIRGRKWLLNKQKEEEKQKLEAMVRDVEFIKLSNQDHDNKYEEMKNHVEMLTNKFTTLTDRMGSLCNQVDTIAAQYALIIKNQEEMRSLIPVKNTVLREIKLPSNTEQENKSAKEDNPTDLEPLKEMIQESNKTDNYQHQPTSETKNTQSHGSSNGSDMSSLCRKLWNGTLAETMTNIVEPLPVKTDSKRQTFQIYEEVTKNVELKEDVKTEKLISFDQPTLPINLPESGSKKKKTFQIYEEITKPLDKIDEDLVKESELIDIDESKPIEFTKTENIDAMKSNNDNFFDLSVYHVAGLRNRLSCLDGFTFALPSSESEFVAQCASTPAINKVPRRLNELNLVTNKNENITRTVLQEKTRGLSTIVEQSSSSSSSTSSAATTSRPLINFSSTKK